MKRALDSLAVYFCNTKKWEKTLKLSLDQCQTKKCPVPKTWLSRHDVITILEARQIVSGSSMQFVSGLLMTRQYLARDTNWRDTILRPPIRGIQHLKYNNNKYNNVAFQNTTVYEFKALVNYHLKNHHVKGFPDKNKIVIDITYYK